MTNHPNRNRRFYATHNSHTDFRNCVNGFLNTWEVSRFRTAAERDAFVEKYENKDAMAVTRKEAEQIWRDCYSSTGEKIPSGGLFRNTGGVSHFWNENVGS